MLREQEKNKLKEMEDDDHRFNGFGGGMDTSRR